jgi:hypothetical protein
VWLDVREVEVLGSAMAIIQGLVDISLAQQSHTEQQQLATDAGNNPKDQWDEHLSEGRSGTSTVAARTK